MDRAATLLVEVDDRTPGLRTGTLYALSALEGADLDYLERVEAIKVDPLLTGLNEREKEQIDTMCEATATSLLKGDVKSSQPVVGQTREQSELDSTQLTVRVCTEQDDGKQTRGMPLTEMIQPPVQTQEKAVEATQPEAPVQEGARLEAIQPEVPVQEVVLPQTEVVQPGSQPQELPKDVEADAFFDDDFTDVNFADA